MNAFQKIFRYIKESTTRTAVGLAVIGSVVGAGAQIIYAQTSYDVTSEPQMRLDVSITSTQTTGIRIAQPTVNGNNVTFSAETGGVLRLRDPFATNNWEDVYYSNILQNANGTFTLTGTVIRDVCRTVARAIQGCGNGRAFDRGAIVELTIHHVLLNKKADIDRANEFTASGALKFSGSGSFSPPQFSTTAERDAQMGASGNEIRMACVTATNLCYLRLGGSWTTIGDAGTPDATLTTAGKVELASTGSVLAESQNGDSGAPNVVWNGILTATGGSSLFAGRIPYLNANGLLPSSVLSVGGDKLQPRDATLFGSTITNQTSSTGSISFSAIVASVSSSATEHTIPWTATGSNPLVVVMIEGSFTTDLVSGVTYGGKTMTRIARLLNAPPGRSQFAYYIADPITNVSQDIVVTLSSAQLINYRIATYNGVDNVNPIGATGTGTDTSSTSFALSVTPTKDAWVVMTASNSVSNYAAGAGTTVRNISSVVIADSNAIKTANAPATLTLTSSSSNHGGIIFAINPKNADGGPTAQSISFGPDQTESAEWNISLPSSFAGSTVDVTLYWKSRLAGDVKWNVQANSWGDGETYPSTYSSSGSTTDTTTADAIQKVTISDLPVGGSPSGGDMVSLRVLRDAINGSDTLTTDAELIGVTVNY